MKFFATAVPGIGPILAREIEDDPLVSGRAVSDSDGRHDHVAFDAKGGFEVTRLRTSEDVFVQIAEAKPAALSALVRRLWDSAAVERAVSVYAHQVRPLRPRMSYRVVARVLVLGLLVFGPCDGSRPASDAGNRHQRAESGHRGTSVGLRAARQARQRKPDDSDQCRVSHEFLPGSQLSSAAAGSGSAFA